MNKLLTLYNLLEQVTRMKQPLRVLYDYQTFHIQRFGGISRYFHEIMNCMPGAKPKIAIRYSMNQYIRDKKLSRHTYVPKRLFKVMEGVFRSLNRSRSVKSLRGGDFDLFHPTYYHPYFLESIGNKPFVLTIHDMTHERFPQYFSPTDPTPGHKRILAKKATRIIAISECTKRDVMEFLHVPEDKIDVIYHGLTPQTLAVGRPEGLPAHYILYVGERRGYKNFELVVKAFTRIAQQHPSLHLVLTGRPLSKGEQEMFRQAGLVERVKVMSDISDLVLAQLYRNASLFVYPSLYEGFGIPILEAFAQECPVVLSRASCFPEVAGDAAEYFEPTELDSLVIALNRVLTDEARCTELIRRGKERLSRFTWEETAQQTEKTYKMALLSS